MDRGFLAPHFLEVIEKDRNEILRFIRQNRTVIGDNLNQRLDIKNRSSLYDLTERGMIHK